MSGTSRISAGLRQLEDLKRTGRIKGNWNSDDFNDLASSVAKMASMKLDENAAKALEEHARSLERIFKEEFASFKVVGPQALPTKDRFGKYTTTSFKGGEELRPVGAYVGKRDGLIYVFQPRGIDAGRFAFVEVAQKDSGQALAGFRGWLEEKLQMNEDELIARVQRERELAEREERERVAKMRDDNPVFGSW
jgi:hypothetical protein